MPLPYPGSDLVLSVPASARPILLLFLAGSVSGFALVTASDDFKENGAARSFGQETGRHHRPRGSSRNGLGRDEWGAPTSEVEEPQDHEYVWSRVLSDPGEFTCAILLFVAASLAASAGTGGGGMFVPLLLIFSEIRPELTVPLSQSMILCSSFVNLVCFVSQRHPMTLLRAKVDYDCVVLLEPMLCFGVTLGVAVHRVAPQWLCTMLLCVTLGSALWKTSQKGLKQRREEQATEAARSNSTSNLLPETRKSFTIADCLAWCRTYSAEVINLITINRRQLVGIASVWATMLVASFQRLPFGSMEYFVYLACLACFLTVCTVYIGRNLVRTPPDEEPDELKGNASFDEDVQLIRWVADRSFLSYLRYPSVAFAAGLLGGSLGLGGGIVVSPVLLEVGMHSEAVQATTAAFVFLSSSLATIQYVMLGQVMWDYALFYCGLAVAATALGQYLCEVYVRRHKRYSAITLSIAGVLLLSLAALCFIGVRDMYVAVQDPEVEMRLVEGQDS